MRYRFISSRLAAGVLALGFALAAAADAETLCQGKDMIAAMPAKERAAIEARADAAPFARGNLWQATRNGKRITLAGTLHVDDPREAGLLAALLPALHSAHLLLVEAGPKEMAAMKNLLKSDPSLVVAPSGQSLYTELPRDAWNRMAKALAARGVPGTVAARLRPWYVMLVLGTPPCEIQRVKTGGLDMKLMKAAEAQHLPIRALEPADTILKIFNGMSQSNQLALLDTALAGASDAESSIVTLANAYFGGQSRLMLEFSAWQTTQLPGISPQKAAKEQALMVKALVTDRNRSWIPVIEKAAKNGPVLVAFGALHLSGKQGVLELLKEDGWKVTPYRH